MTLETIVKSATTQNIMDLRPAVGQFFYKAQIQDPSPLHVVAGFGNLTLFTMIEKICPLQYSEDISSSLKPIHIAAMWGQLEVLKYILNQMEVKDPKTHDGAVPLHFAGKGGILENCDFLIKNVSNMNPIEKRGWTPPHLAVHQGPELLLDVHQFTLLLSLVTSNCTNIFSQKH